MKEIRIQPYDNPGGSVSFKVSGMVQGRHRRKNVATESEALTVKQNWERENLNAAPLPAITTRLTAEQLNQAESCLARLQGKPFSLVEAVDFALANYRPAMTPKPIGPAFAEFIEAKRAQNLRPATLAKLIFRVGQLVCAHGGSFDRDKLNVLVTLPGRPVHEVQPEQLRAIIHRPGSSPQNQDTDARAFSCFLNWCKAQGHLSANPLDKVGKVKLDRIEPEVLTLAQALALLNAAQAHKRAASLVPYVVLAMFCAIRPTEIARLSWDDVDLTTRTVTIGGKVAKMRARRLVAIADNALAFLLPYAAQHAPFVHPNFKNDWKEVREAAGLPPCEWVADILRHTGISYHFAQGKHEGQTAEWAGNSPTVIHRHYKALVKAADAVEFWNILPGAGEIVSLPKAANG